jgi:histidinol-phosphate aminotransferase
MSRFFDLVSKPARAMSNYPATPPPRTAPVETQPRLIKLDSNENPYGPSPRAIDAMRQMLPSLNFYPDDDSSELRRRLAGDHNLSADQILVTAGSTAMLSLICHIMLAPGLNAVTSALSFVLYSTAVRATGAQLIEAPMRDDSFDLSAILEVINEHTRVVLLANPNNPTGTMLKADAIDQFLKEVPGHIVVILDEAYYEYAQHFATVRKVEYSRSVEHIQRGASVIVLRSFSKVHGLAGLRIGYGMGPAELLAYCARLRDMFSVSAVAQAAALAALDDQNHIAKTLSSNAEEAQILGVGLSELGFRVVPTFANFLYCDVEEDSSEFAMRLRDEGVSIRALGMWGAPTSIRVSIGTPEQNQFFLNAMHKVREASATRTGRELR